MNPRVRKNTTGKVISCCRNESGAAMVEFAFSATAFLMFIIVTFEVGIIGWRSVTAQYIASQTVREAAMFAGNEGPTRIRSGPNRGRYTDGFNVFQMQEYSRRLAIDYGLNVAARGRGRRRVDPWANSFQACELQFVGAINTANAGKCVRPGGGYPDGVFGEPEDFIAVRISIPSRMLLQLVRFDVVGWAAARNEEFET